MKLYWISNPSPKWNTTPSILVLADDDESPHDVVAQKYNWPVDKVKEKWPDIQEEDLERGILHEEWYGDEH